MPAGAGVKAVLPGSHGALLVLVVLSVACWPLARDISHGEVLVAGGVDLRSD